MNKQKAIEEINNLKGLTILDKTINFDSEMISKKEVLNIVKQFDEPVRPPEPKPLELEKPVVPRFVADWIEWCKKNNATLLGAISPIDELGTAICDDKKVESLDASRWATRNQETFAKAWLYGYEIEKEKLYTVEIPNPNAEERPILFKKRDGKVHIIFPSIPCWRSVKNAQLTESEIKKDFAWAWEFAEVVEK